MSKISSPSDDVTSPLPPEEGIAVVELADELQIRKQTVFKVMKRLGIQAVKRREYDRRGQMISVIRKVDADAIRDDLRRTTSGECVKTWPCRRTWERAAIDCVTTGAERLHTEVFRVGSVQVVIDRADNFFGVMPVIPDTPEGDSADDDVAVKDAV